MLILATRDGELWSAASTAGALASFCAEVIRSRALAGCLAPLPADAGARRRLFTFLRSLKRASGGRAAIALHASEVTADRLLECAVAGVDQVVILQGVEDPRDAIASVALFRESEPTPPPLLIHVWIDPARPGDVHRTASAWARAAGADVYVELAPAVLEAGEGTNGGVHGTPNGAGHVVRNGSGDVPHHVACEWLRSTITVHPSGAIVPCPHHAPRADLSLERKPADLLFAITSLPQALDAHPTCRGCTRRMRFTIPQWMRSGDAPPRAAVDAGDAATTAAAEAAFVDHVKGRLDDVDPPMRETLIDAFIARARSTVDP